MCQLHYNERLLRLYCNMHMYKEDQFTRVWSIIRSKGFSGRDLLTAVAHPRTLAAGPLQVEKPELTLRYKSLTLRDFGSTEKVG